MVYYSSWDDYDEDCVTDRLPYAMCQLCWLFIEAVTMDMLAATTGVTTNARIGTNIVAWRMCFRKRKTMDKFSAVSACPPN